MDDFVQVGDCLVNVLDSLLTKTASVTTGVHEVVAGSREFVHRSLHLRRHVLRNIGLRYEFPLAPKRKKGKSLDSCGAAHLCLDIGGAPEGQTCKIAPIFLLR